MNTKALNRRSFIGLASACLGGLATFSVPKVSFASIPNKRNRLAFVLLRGGFDGLAAVPPTFDPDYQKTRGNLAVPPTDLIALTDGFCLTPGLSPLTEFWKRGEMTIVHAMAIPYRTRSHFDGQAVLETGIDKPSGSSDGWLNRLLGVIGGSHSGIAIAAGLPRSLSGEAPVSTWSPAKLGVVNDAFLDKLQLLYRADARLHDRFEAALAQQALNDELDVMSGSGRVRTPRGDVDGLFRAAARLMSADDGPNIAALEMSGWDTHVNQGIVGGQLDRLLGRLASGLNAFRDEMGDQWSGTTVVVMTEFGRAAKPNGSNGTDHGTAGAGFILGDRVTRSQVITEWPGLAEKNLFEGRDLAPTIDTRAVLKGVIAGTFDLTKNQVNRVFPGSSEVTGLWNVMA